MYVILWEFHVKPGRCEQFSAIYSPHGEWAQLFAQAPGYLGTELLESTEDATRFVTIDRWTREEDFKSFQESYRNPYAALDQLCEDLTLSERTLGTFTEADLQSNGIRA